LAEPLSTWSWGTNRVDLIRTSGGILGGVREGSGKGEESL